MTQIQRDKLQIYRQITRTIKANTKESLLPECCRSYHNDLTNLSIDMTWDHQKTNHSRCNIYITESEFNQDICHFQRSNQ